MSYSELNKLNCEINIIEQKKNELKKQMKDEIIELYAKDILNGNTDIEQCKKLLMELIQEIKYTESN